MEVNTGDSSLDSVITLFHNTLLPKTNVARAYHHDPSVFSLHASRRTTLVVVTQLKARFTTT